MTVPVYQTADNTSTYGTTSGAQTVAKPTNLAEGDLILWYYQSNDVAVAGEAGVTIPSGFTLIRTELDSGSTTRIPTVVAYKIATSSEPSTYGFTVAGTYAWIAACGRVTGHNGTSPIDVSGGNNTAGVAQNSFTLNGVTTTVADCLVVSVASARYNAATTELQWGDSATPVFNLRASAGLPDRFISRADSAVSAGATTARVADIVGAETTRWSGVAFAIAPTAAVRNIPDMSPLYYGTTLLANKTGIEYSVTDGHDDISGSIIASGVNGTTDASGVFIFPGTATFGTATDPVTVHLYWEEGSDPVVDRSLIVKTTLVAEA